MTRIFKIINIKKDKRLVELICETTGNDIVWQLGTVLDINSYVIGSRYQVTGTEIIEIN